MNDIARKVAKRLYDGDEIKCKFIFQFLKAYKISSDTYKYDEFARILSEGNLDEHIMGLIEFFESRCNIDDLKIKHDIEISEFKKIREFCENENMLYLIDIEKLDKNSTKKFFERFMKYMDEYVTNFFYDVFSGSLEFNFL